MLIHILVLIWYMAFTLTLPNAVASVSPASNTLILRVRKADGSMDRVVVSKDEIETTTLSSILLRYASSDDDGDKENVQIPKCQIGTGNGPSRQFKDVKNADEPLSSLNLQNGSIINIMPVKRNKEEQKQKNKDADSKIPDRYTEFDPFPDIAKSSHSTAARRSRALSRLPSKRSMSYGEISKLREYMHTIEPQSQGPIKRIYMCHLGAQRFKDNCTIMPTKKQLKALILFCCKGYRFV